MLRSRSVAALRSVRRSGRLVSSLSLATWERVALAPNVLNLAVGQPALSLLPMEVVQQAANCLSEFDARYLLQYGSAAGSEHYLTAVASFLSAEVGEACDPATLFATPGNSGGLALVTRRLTDPGDMVLMEEPSYFLAHQIFRDNHCTLIQARQRTDGGGTLDVDALDELLARKSSAAGGQMPKLLYCVPTGNNPTGNTMPDADRARLVRLCAEHGVRIVADDVYEVAIASGVVPTPPTLCIVRANEPARSVRSHELTPVVICLPSTAAPVANGGRAEVAAVARAAAGRGVERRLARLVVEDSWAGPPAGLGRGRAGGGEATRR